MNFKTRPGPETALFLLTLWLVLISACAGKPPQLGPVPSAETAGETIRRFEKDVAAARRDGVNVLSPTWFAGAEASLAAAVKKLADSGNPDEAMPHLSRGLIQLLAARDKSQLALTLFPETIKSRDIARNAGAVELGEVYSKTERKFFKLCRAVEENDLVYVKKHRADVAQEYRQLELQAIKFRLLGEVRNLLELARQEGSDKIAPETYTAAVKQLDEADRFITMNRYRESEIRNKAKLALFLAKRHAVIAEICQQIETMEPEAIALLVQNNLHAVSEKLSAPDMRDNRLEMQVENILGMIAALQYERSAILTKSEEQQRELEQYRRKGPAFKVRYPSGPTPQSQLHVRKEFDAVFAKVASYFLPAEADVIKRDLQIVIRLKAMEFPVGESRLLPNNYPLLGKVQRALRTFDEADLIIEGHTDSTGAEDANEHLSERRAEAVRLYLVETDTIGYDKVIAVGYGAMRPLASNQTAEGRAVNRRIDLVITPHFD